ncbi:MAG: hypothetical protein D0531_12145 [Methylococcales bacterium]|nr:MAG: hypothetical protein D0531_12145 [Methylococcales bacterium]
MPIQQDLDKCINDTRTYVSNGAAKTLMPWRYYPIPQLIASIQRAIRIGNNQANGFIIHSKGGVSLEQIVLKYADFTEDDRAIANATLGNIV